MAVRRPPVEGTAAGGHGGVSDGAVDPFHVRANGTQDNGIYEKRPHCRGGLNVEQHVDVQLRCVGRRPHSHGLRGPGRGERLGVRRVGGQHVSGAVECVNAERKSTVDLAFPLAVHVNVPSVVRQFARHGERGLEGGHTNTGTGIGGTVVNDGTPKRGYVLVFKCDVPDHHFVDHAFEVGTSCPIDAKLVEVNVGE